MISSVNGGKKTKILIVDDKKDNISALESLIEREDLEVCTAMSGQEALGLVLDNEFCLAILDAQMPDMSGFELAELMRGTKRSSQIPIIFVAASQETEHFVFDGYELGAVDVIFKPLSPHIVRCKINTFLTLHQQNIALQEKLEEIEVLRANAMGANESKVRFLANISHEIRTPLSAILGYASLLGNEKIEDRMRSDFSEVIARNGKHLSKLVDEILDFSKIEAGMFTYDFKDFLVTEIISFCVDNFQGLADSKGVALQLRFQDDAPRTIMADSYRTTQILNNIIGNAVKFTSHGSVKINVSSIDVCGDQYLSITVDDTGCGISPHALSHLFKPFFQEDEETSRKFGGTGLGLAISRSLAFGMGGDVRLLKTISGRGCTFQVLIPVKRSNDSDMENLNQLNRA